MSENVQYNKMIEEPIPRLILRLGIPTTISMLVTSIYNMADTYFVGGLGDSESGAVSVVFGLMAIIQALGFMFGHGAGSIIARRLGAQDSENAGKYASVSFFVSLFTGAVVGSFGLIFIDPLMRLFGSTATILPYARDYGQYILIAAPVMMSSFVLNNILRYEGKAYLAMIGLTTGGVLNIIFDPIFIKGLNMGVGGAGLATALSQCISFSILLSMFLRGKTQSKIAFKQVFSNMNMLPLILKTGFPSFVRQGLNSVATSCLNHYAGFYYEDAAVAAMGIVNRICFFVFAVGLGIGQGFQPVCGFNYGAKRYDRVKKAFWFTWGVGEVFLGTLAIVGILLSGNLIGLFREGDPIVIEIGTLALRCQLLALFVQPITICATMLFQSVGANKQATLFSMLRNGLIFIPLLAALHAAFGLLGVQIAQSIADAITFAITLPVVLTFLKKLDEKEKEQGLV